MQRNYEIDVSDDKKNIFTYQSKYNVDPNGNKIEFTNYYMMMNNKPFFVVSGEFHYSRYDEKFWEDEIIKMKMCGVNTISTYVFWIHHEEIHGNFDWSGNKNLRKFVKLCAKHGMYVIVRIGPFSHGEVRNGGLPDWLFWQLFDVRSNDEEYLKLVRIFYREISRQLKGLYFEDGGPIIGIQIENEYMHAGAPIELSVGTSNEWVPSGTGGEAHIKILKSIAIEEGIKAPFYTATAWGGAMAPTDETFPMWGGYAFWPWIFYGDVKEHPPTPEYIFRNYHDNRKPKQYNFEPRYAPEDYPYACCEIGGGMTVFYPYRFIVPSESVKALSIVKVAGGANFIGYYMFHGGSNPKGKTTLYLNEHVVPKISYDFQAPLGEFGQIRESYQKLKTLHYFLKTFEELICKMKTILPEDAETISPENVDALRYAVRVKNDSGFIFINNYQDHVSNMKEKKGFHINIKLKKKGISIPQETNLSISAGESYILPFNMNLDGINLEYSTTQPITFLKNNSPGKTYFFFTPDGMKGEYCFSEENIKDIVVQNGVYKKKDGKIIVDIDETSRSFINITSKTNSKLRICTISSKESQNFWKTEISGKEMIFLTPATPIISDTTFRLESNDKKISLSIFPDFKEFELINGGKIISKKKDDIFATYEIDFTQKNIDFEVIKNGENRAFIKFNESLNEYKEVFLRIYYVGDIGYAFIGDELINDNFSNGSVWEIGLKRFSEKLMKNGIRIFVSPIKKSSIVKTDSTMAGRSEILLEKIAQIRSINLVPIYEATINFTI